MHPPSFDRETVEHIIGLLRSGTQEDSPLPVRDTLERYFAFQRPRKTAKSFANDRCYLELFFREVKLGDLRAVSPAIVSEYLSGRAALGRSPKTLNRSREVLHAMFAWLVELERIQVNPIARVRRAAEPAPTIRYLSVPQIEELLRVLDGDRFLRSFVAMLAYSGLRRGEAIWLRWENVDLERKLLEIRAKGREWQPKTKRNRLVPIHRRMLPYLESLDRSSEWVHPSPRGGRWDPDNLTHRFRKKVRKAGLPWTLLDLRHTFGTQLVMKGVSLVKVAALMGNSPEICRRHYAHVSTELLHADVDF